MEKACLLLGIPLNSSQAVIKRAYYKKALVLHPDKNSDTDAGEKFRELQEAYTLLKDTSFEEKEEKWFDSSAMLDMLANSLSEETLLSMYKFLVEYKDFIPEHQYLLSLIESKLTRPYITVEPSLKSLFEQKIFIYTHENGKKYSIPLWQHTLFFDDLIVVCTPKVDDSETWLDDMNNIHITVYRNVSNLLRMREISFPVAEHTFTVQASELAVVALQTYVLRGRGVPSPNVDNVLDVSKVSDIVVHIHLS